MSGKIPSSWLISAKEREDWNICPRDWLQSHQAQSTDAPSILKITRDSWEQCKSLEHAIAPDDPWYGRQTPGGARNYEFLRKKKEKETGKSLSLIIYIDKLREDTYTKKFWEAPRISGQADWWVSPPGWGLSMKIGRGSYFFLMYKYQHKG